jgi:hypothetical protein
MYLFVFNPMRKRENILRKMQQSINTTDDERVKRVRGATGLFHHNTFVPTKVQQFLNEIHSKNLETLTDNDPLKEEVEFEEFKRNLNASATTIPINNTIQQQQQQQQTSNTLFNAPAQPEAQREQQLQEEYEQYKLFQEYKQFVAEQDQQQELEYRQTMLLDMKDRLHFTVTTYRDCYEKCIEPNYTLNVTQYLSTDTPQVLSNEERNCLISCAQNEYEVKQLARESFLNSFFKNSGTFNYSQDAMSLYHRIRGPIATQQGGSRFPQNAFTGLGRMNRE